MSPPPIRAATSTFLISLANILPRRASMTAFLCLVVAHLEWPLIACFLSLRTFPTNRTSLRGGAYVAVDVPLQVGRHRVQHLGVTHRGDRFDLPDIPHQRQPNQLAGDEPAAFE